jgi:photosystem II stability/assembly factor-like uncharacterized protein
MKHFFLVIIILSIQVNVISQNSGWTLVNSGTTEDLNAVHSQFATIFACGNSGTILKSLDSGKTWQSMQSPIIKNLNDVYVRNPEVIIVVGDGGTIIRTTDGGSTWNTIYSGVTEDLYSVDFHDGTGLIGGDSQRILWCFLDWGLTWEISYTGTTGDGFMGASLTGHQTGFVGGENSNSQPLLGIGSDHGQVWEFIPFYLNGNKGKITDTDFFYREDPGFATSQLQDGRGAISKTTDEGETWVTTIFNTPLFGITTDWSLLPRGRYAVGESGIILKSYDLGETWQQQQSGTTVNLNNVDVSWMDVDYVFVVGDNGTILRTTTGGEPINRSEDENQKPYKYALEQNYPNPFNPTTTIKYQIPELSFVTLRVYDVLGNEVAALINQEKSAGSYEVEFNGNELTSGIYFYRLQAGFFIETKKMLLIK